MATKIQLRRDTSSSWGSVNPTLSQGEPGIETNTGKIKLGTGTAAWNCLPYLTTCGCAGAGTWATLGCKNTACGPSKIALGRCAGSIGQQYCTVAIGPCAGSNCQGQYATAVGLVAGYCHQGCGSVAVGSCAGYNYQGSASTAIGLHAAAGASAITSVVSTTGPFLQVDSLNCIQVGMRVIGTGICVGQRVQGICHCANTVTLSRNNCQSPTGPVTFTSGQCAQAVAVGYYAGAYNQRIAAVAVGACTAVICQGQGAVAIGPAAAYDSQGCAGIAIGPYAGSNMQGKFSTAIGVSAGNQQQSSNAIAIGTCAGNYNQSCVAVSIGKNAGKWSQSCGGTAIGFNAGFFNQSIFAMAFGTCAGAWQQGCCAVAIGLDSGKGLGEITTVLAVCGSNFANITVGCSGQIVVGSQVYGVGIAGGTTVTAVVCGNITLSQNYTGDINASIIFSGYHQGRGAVAVGSAAGEIGQGAHAIAVGACAGATFQGYRSIAIGVCAGGNLQLADGIAIGSYAGYNNQCNDSIAIGSCAGYCRQGEEAIAIGISAGFSNQQRNAIAIGRWAGSCYQGCSSIAIGHYAAGSANGGSVQGRHSVAIGYAAGQINQGNTAVAIGYAAGYNSQVDNSIAINATGCGLNPANSGLYISPVRQCVCAANNTIYYNTTTKELTYGPNSGLVIPCSVQTALGTPNVAITATIPFGPCHAAVAIHVASHAPVISTGVIITAGACANAPVVPGTAQVGDQTITITVPGSGAPYTAYAWLQTPFTTIFSPPVSSTSGICFVKGTMISLSDGTYRAIEDITYNDLLLVWDFDQGKYAEARPVWIKVVETEVKYNILTFSDGTTLRTVGNHHIFNKTAQRFTHTMRADTPLGTITINEYGVEVVLVSAVEVNETVESYNIFTKHHLNMYANGILTSNRFNNIWPIDNMRFVKDSRALRPMSEFAGIDLRWVHGLRLCEQTSEHSADYIRWYIGRLEYYDVYGSILV